MMPISHKPGWKPKKPFGRGISSLSRLRFAIRIAPAANLFQRPGKPTASPLALTVRKLPNATPQGAGASHAQAQKTH